MKTLVVLFCCLSIVGCATQPKTFHAPDASVVNAATTDLNVKIDRARDTATKARTASETTQKSASVVVDLGKTLDVQIETLLQKLPEQYRPLVDQVKSAKKAEDVQVQLVIASANASVKWNTQLQSEVQDAEKARQTLQGAQDAYAGGAASLADDASKERAARVKDEEALHWYRWHFFLTWFVAGAGLLVCIAIAVLKFTGRLTLFAGQVASKIP